jgi:hypothetical protein
MFYSLMLGLTGFSLMLCSLFYASPASMRETTLEVVVINQSASDVPQAVALQQASSMPSAPSGTYLLSPYLKYFSDKYLFSISRRERS